ncbi:hypothetical protein J6590_054987 [Homalodisca vitripennis]|nr:hypothetical protein J6590_054987 [Homalodisca vitripennis]
MDVNKSTPSKDITYCQCRDNVMEEWMDKYNLLHRMTLGVSGAPLVLKADGHEEVLSPAFFDWRCWNRTGIPFFQGN